VSATKAAAVAEESGSVGTSIGSLRYHSGEEVYRLALSHLSRRRFLHGLGAAVAASPTLLNAWQNGDSAPSLDWRSIQRRLAAIGTRVRQRYRDPRRHFIFEYYPWYGTSPWRHWDGSGRTPPVELSASSLPLLGGYDSRAVKTIEQHARWIADAGVGAINLSWWGRGSYEDESVHVVMDVMRAFDIKVTFHLEPYNGKRGIQFADDVAYILREYGERRRWDTMLLLERADGRAAPVFKLFVAILSPTSTDCLGITTPVDIYVPDDVWRQQLDRVRRDFAADFDTITVVGDSLDAARSRVAGFDACAVGNPYIRPDEWPALTAPFDSRDIPFAFAVNPGFDAVPPKTPPTDPCYQPLPFEPVPDIRWDQPATRAIAQQLGTARIAASLERTLAHQTDPASANWRQGFLMVPINSFNEWHEGTAFEPMASYRDLTRAQRLLYHNTPDGSYRLNVLRDLLGLLQ